MKIINKEIFIPKEIVWSIEKLSDFFSKDIFAFHSPIRFVATQTVAGGYLCEVDFISYEKGEYEGQGHDKRTIFNFSKRGTESIDKFVVALIIPTGIGAEIGGHCGDANVVARLLASACDLLITHPNVVNASDMNEMTENMLYVEGSILTRLFMGSIGLRPVRSNRILMLMDENRATRFFNDEVINAVSSARVTLGIDCDVLEMKEKIESRPTFAKSGRASGSVNRLERLFSIIEKNRNNYDAIGLTTVIDVDDNICNEYFKSEKYGVNPWGSIEAMITHSIAETYKIPCAHSPMTGSTAKMHIDMDLGVVDPRKAPETASVTYLHCILKGLHKSPRVVEYSQGLNVENISCLVIPNGCIGLPVLACIEHGIPVIAVNNINVMKNDLRSLLFKEGKLFFAANYLEVVGILKSIKSGISPETVLRPIVRTKVLL